MDKKDMKKKRAAILAVINLLNQEREQHNIACRLRNNWAGSGRQNIMQNRYEMQRRINKRF